jgi:hypothetical protein
VYFNFGCADIPDLLFSELPLRLRVEYPIGPETLNIHPAIEPGLLQKLWAIGPSRILQSGRACYDARSLTLAILI